MTDLLYLHVRESSIHQWIRKYTWKNYYNNSIGNCLTGYGFDQANSLCIKGNLNQTNNGNNVNNGANNSTNNSLNNLTNSSLSTLSNNGTNNLTNISSAPFLTFSNYSSFPSSIKNYSHALNTPAINFISNIIGKILTFTSMKIAPGLLLSFTGFLDDIWFYKYHQN